MHKITLLIFFLSIFTHVSGQTDNWHESDYSDYIQQLIGGEREHSVESGRVDLVTEEYAFEIEWANKWKQSIGQSIWYGLQTYKKPGIILLLRSKEDYKYFIQLNTALEYAHLSDQIKVYLFPNDFQEFIEAKQ
jgi:hypothetical protein